MPRPKVVTQINIAKFDEIPRDVAQTYSIAYSTYPNLYQHDSRTQGSSPGFSSSKTFVVAAVTQSRSYDQSCPTSAHTISTKLVALRVELTRVDHHIASRTPLP